MTLLAAAEYSALTAVAARRAEAAAIDAVAELAVARSPRAGNSFFVIELAKSKSPPTIAVGKFDKKLTRGTAPLLIKRVMSFTKSRKDAESWAKGSASTVSKTIENFFCPCSIVAFRKACCFSKRVN